MRGIEKEIRCERRCRIIMVLLWDNEARQGWCIDKFGCAEDLSIC